MITGISRVKALKQAVISNQTSVEAIQAGFEVGTRTGLDIVNAQRLLLQAQRDYARARYDYILDTLRLKRAAGTLAPTDLVLVNAWLRTISSLKEPHQGGDHHRAALHH